MMYEYQCVCVCVKEYVRACLLKGVVLKEDAEGNSKKTKTLKKTTHSIRSKLAQGR